MTIRDDFIEIHDFFTASDLAKFESVIAKLGTGVDRIVPHGPFANQLITNYLDLNGDLELRHWVSGFITDLLDLPISVESITRIKLFLPWDIHADFYLDRCQPGFQPYYNFLIPLEDIDSATIIFDQCTDGSNDFSEYKQIHGKTEDPVDLEFWNDNLSMCWPHDREYVSLKHVMPRQRRGQLLGFPRRFFHSSDNFNVKHGKSKSFVQIRVDRPRENIDQNCQQQ